MVRRALEIAHFHVPGAAIDWTFQPLLERSGVVRVAAFDLRWQDWQRYSNRQGRSMEMGGFVGTVAGDLAPSPLSRRACLARVARIARRVRRDPVQRERES